MHYLFYMNFYFYMCRTFVLNYSFKLLQSSAAFLDNLKLYFLIITLITLHELLHDGRCFYEENIRRATGLSKSHIFPVMQYYNNTSYVLGKDWNLLPAESGMRRPKAQPEVCQFHFPRAINSHLFLKHMKYYFYYMFLTNSFVQNVIFIHAKYIR